MKQSKKSTVDPDREKIVKKKTRSLKPWVMEYMITDPEAFKQVNYSPSGYKLDTWITDSYFSYLSLDQALKELNKTARSYGGPNNISVKTHWRFLGRSIRLHNVDTDELVNLTVTDNDIIKTV